MTIRHAFRKSQRTPEETASLIADRERYLREKPTPEQLLLEGGHDRFIPMGELLQIHQVAFALKRTRERQGVTLAELERRTGIDQAALSRIENAKNPNPTLDTLYRVALALGKMICFTFQDAPESFDEKDTQQTRKVPTAQEVAEDQSGIEVQQPLVEPQTTQPKKVKTRKDPGTRSKGQSKRNEQPA
jgi:transcriptional regulator with XRE-family HTH domain